MLLKFPLKYFRGVQNLILRLSSGVWKQPESLSPEGYKKGRPKKGSLNQFQQPAYMQMGAKQEWSMFSESIKSPVRGVPTLIPEKYRKSAKKQQQQKKLWTFWSWDVSKYLAQTRILTTPANMIYTYIISLSITLLMFISHNHLEING